MTVIAIWHSRQNGMPDGPRAHGPRRALHLPEHSTGIRQRLPDRPRGSRPLILLIVEFALRVVG